MEKPPVTGNPLVDAIGGMAADYLTSFEKEGWTIVRDPNLLPPCVKCGRSTMAYNRQGQMLCVKEHVFDDADVSVRLEEFVNHIEACRARLRGLISGR